MSLSSRQLAAWEDMWVGQLQMLSGAGWGGVSGV